MARFLRLPAVDEVVEHTGKTIAGDGERLGTAYRLANGQIIYVPEGPDATNR